MEYYVVNYHKAAATPLAISPNDPALSRDTGSATAVELRAEPQYSIMDAYWLIYKNAVYPFNLPYHQPLDVIRKYLDFVKTNRAELLDIFPFYKDASNNSHPISANAVDAERLSMSLNEYKILTGVNFLGTSASNPAASVYFGSPSPAYTDGSIQVLDLLQRTGLDYTDLVVILETVFINPGQKVYDVLQSLMSGSSIDPQVFYNELKNGNWNSNTSETYKKVLQPIDISLASFGNWFNNGGAPSKFENFQQLITLYDSSADPCDLGMTVLKSVQMIYEGAVVDIEGFLSNLHRFIRLWRKMGWSVHEMDVMINAVGNNVLDANLIHNLGIVEQVKSLLQLPLTSLAAIWGDIDTNGSDSLYTQLFLKNTGYITNNGILQQDVFVPDPLNEILAQNSALSASSLTAVYAALSISAEEYNTIIADAGIGDTASLKNLSIVYRYKLLAGALQLSIGDLCILKSTACFNINPFGKPDDTLLFIRQVQDLQASGFSVALLNYILSGTIGSNSDITLSSDTILAPLPDLRTKFLSIAGEIAGDDAKTQSQQTLIFSTISALTGLGIPAQFIPAAISNSLMTALPGTGLTGNYFSDIDFETSVAIQTDAAINFSWGTAAPALTMPADGFSIRWQGWICPPANGDYTFTIKVSETDEAARLWIGGTKVIDKTAGAAVTTLGKISLHGGKFYPVIIEYVETSGNAGIQLSWQTDSMPQVIVDTTFLYTDSLVQAFLKNIILCHRPAQFISSFQLTSEEVNYFLNNKQDFDNIDLFALTAIHWQRIYNYSVLRKTIPASSLLSLFQEAATDAQSGATNLPSGDLVTAIVNSTGWNKDYLSYLAGNAGNPAISPPVTAIPSFYGFTVTDLKNEIAFLQIKRALDLAKRTNMPISDSGLPSWVQVEKDLASPDDFNALHGVAEQIKNAVKSKHNDNWLTIARQLNDIIRENQKQALVSYLLTLDLSLGSNKVTDADSLYEYLLIDVQMSPVVVTSRLIQATMAVQLFADRCLLGLEKESVAVDAINADEWDWMKHYSIAAGLKKLFVYVENYLDPSLRDDKSPFFEELESELKENDITDENAENAFRDYLYKLNEVSNMEMCGLYNDEETKSLHVFARTHSAPYNYYYRTQDSYGYWSAWEQVQLDIKSTDDGNNSGVHLMPVIWKKRLFLFWPEFMQKTLTGASDSSNFSTMADTSTPADNAPQKYWEIRLAGSEYANGKWTPKKVSKEYLSPMATDPKIYEKLATVRPDQYSFQLTKDAYNVLTVWLNISRINEYTTFDKTYEVIFIGNFVLTDIHEKILTPPSSPWLVDANSTFLLHPYYLDPDSVVDSSGHFGYRSLYESFYQSFKKNNVLDLSNVNFLRNVIDHRVLYSNDMVLPNFSNNVRYPFFYTDSTAQRTYFVSPYNLSIFQNPGNLVNAVNAPLALSSINQPVSQTAVKGMAGADIKSKTLTTTLPVVAKTITTKPIATNTMILTASTLTANNSRYYPSPVLAYPAPFNTTTNPNYLNNPKLAFYTFYHPFASILIKKLNEGGVEKLLEADTAEYPDVVHGLIDNTPARVANDGGTTFAAYDADYTRVKKYDPLNADPARNYYLENVDFSKYGAYSIYNWEVFFHAPFLIATRLSKNGKYAEARKWFHYIFNPLAPGANDDAAAYWQVLPFKTTPLTNITSYIQNLSPGYDPDPNNPRNDYNAQIDQWRADPFNAFLIARNRPIAFMKNVVMSYLDNLIAWGDDLFRTYTRENINEATQLYVMAAQILGPKPQYVPVHVELWWPKHHTILLNPG